MKKIGLIEFLFPFLWGGGIAVLAVFFAQGVVLHRLSDGFSVAGVVLLAKRYFSTVKRKGFFNGLRYVGERIKERLLPFIRTEQGSAVKEDVKVRAVGGYGELAAGLVYLAVGGGFLFFM